MSPRYAGSAFVTVGLALIVASVVLDGRPRRRAPEASPTKPSIDRASRAEDEPMRSSADEIASYTLRATLDTGAHAVKGEGTIRWTNASRTPATELFFHLYLNAFKNERTVFMRFPGTDGFRGGGSPAQSGSIDVEHLVLRSTGEDLWRAADKSTPGDPDDETDIRVPLPTPVEPGATIDLDVVFTAHLPSLVFRTGHVNGFHMVAQWFPKLARREADGRWAHFAFHHLSEFYADFGTYDVTIDTPAEMLVGATGEAVVVPDSKPANGRATQRFRAENVHDFAWTAWERFKELRADAEGVDVRVLYPPGLEDVALLELTSVRFGLRHFGNAYGRYPYRTLTVVHPPADAEEAGGMEYPTLITTGGSWLLPKVGVRSIEGITIHELGHQWFYGLVATDEHDAPFLDEGLNSYAEFDALEAMFPDASGADTLGLSISRRALSRLGALAARGFGPVAQPAPAFATGAEYADLVYQRTAIILDTLARVYGEDLLRSAVGRYTRRYRFEHPGAEELLTVFDEVMGADVARTLRAALFDRASVDFVAADLQSVADASAGGFRGEVLVRRLGDLKLPVDVDLHAEDGSVQRVRWNGEGSATRLSYRGTTPLVAAVIDPDHRVLLDEDLSNNAVSVSPRRLGDPVFDRSFFAAEAVLSCVLP